MTVMLQEVGADDWHGCILATVNVQVYERRSPRSRAEGRNGCPVRSVDFEFGRGDISFCRIQRQYRYVRPGINYEV